VQEVSARVICAVQHFHVTRVVAFVQRRHHSDGEIRVILPGHETTWRHPEQLLDERRQCDVTRQRYRSPFCHVLDLNVTLKVQEFFL